MKTSVGSIVQDAENYVEHLLLEDLTPDHRYHNLPHTLAVRNAALEIARRLELGEEEREILELACLFHDTGFVETYEGHEAVSYRIAKDFLEQRDYPPEKKEQVLRCIEVTFPSIRPVNLLEKVIRDADLANLGSPRYLEALTALRHEWEVFLGQRFPDSEWYRLNRSFLKSIRFFTAPAEEMWEANKKTHEKTLKQLTKQIGKGPANTIQSNRSAQMMFKTALRNHLDLSALADNKANIMLSVNALILTIAAPLALSTIESNVLLLIPLIFLLITCLSSMIFATLATRPIKMNGRTSREQIEEGRSNLFFFGNFYAMNFDDYSQGMEEVIADSDKLEDSIRRDLFFLGRSLGAKYNQLRTCYLIFMIGMVVTIAAMIVTYTLSVVQ